MTKTLLSHALMKQRKSPHFAKRTPLPWLMIGNISTGERKKEMTAKKRDLGAQGMAYAVARQPAGVTLVFPAGSVTGINDVGGRELHVGLSVDELGTALGALPALEIPASVWSAYTVVLSWLHGEQQEHFGLHERRRAERMQDPDYRAAYEKTARDLKEKG